MITRASLIRNNSGIGAVSEDVSGYNDALIRKKRDKYIQGLEQRIVKLESAMNLLEKTVKEITK